VSWDITILFVQNAVFPSIVFDDYRNLTNGIDVFGREYICGYLGLNNLKANDYANAVFQCLVRIEPLRNVLIRNDFRNLPDLPSNNFLRSFSLFAKKLFNPISLKASVNPYEILQAIRSVSMDRFKPNTQADAADFLAWLLNYTDRALVNCKLESLPVKGQLQVHSKRVFLDAEQKLEEFYAMLDEGSSQETVKSLPFYFLRLDLPPTPLFRDRTGKSVVPQVNLLELLEKYNGVKTTPKGDFQETYHLTSLPKYFILHIHRFVKTTFGLEKNRTVVTFPVKDLCIGSHSYNLIANISHVGDLRDGQYIAHVLHPASETWFEIRDLKITGVHPQTIFLTDSYIQIWECIQ